MRMIILAAGKGTRMKMDVAKVLVPFAGRTLIDHVVEHALGAEIDPHPIVVVGYQGDTVRRELSAYPVTIVDQLEQLGTGHAVSVCRDAVDPAEDVLVLYGDHPLVSPATIGALADEHETSGATVTLMTYTVPDFGVYEGAFASFGRIIRNKDGQIQAIREAKDASVEEKAIKEVNPAFYVFSGSWLWESIGKLEAKNTQKEYYLTDLVSMAIAQGEPVLTIPGTDLREAVGVNTPEQLRLAQSMMV